MASILVVDDEATLAKNLARFLSGLGHVVYTAGNGREAMRVADGTAIDLLITDINMPDMDGIEILNALRERRTELPVIAISGGGKISKNLLLDSANLLGAVLTLEKPFELAELRKAVESVLAR